MKGLFLKLQEKLFSADVKLAFTAANVKPVKFIDFYKQQYLSQESFDVLILPAVLMEYDIIYGNEKTPAVLNVNLHCCYETYRNTGSTKATPVKALEFFDFVDQVYKHVKDLESECTGKLKLTAENQDKNDAIINVHLFNFTGSYSGRVTNDSEKYDYTEDDNELETDTGLVEKIIEAPVEAPKYNFDD